MAGGTQETLDRRTLTRRMASSRPPADEIGHRGLVERGRSLATSRRRLHCRKTELPARTLPRRLTRDRVIASKSAYLARPGLRRADRERLCAAFRSSAVFCAHEVIDTRHHTARACWLAYLAGCGPDPRSPAKSCYAGANDTGETTPRHISYRRLRHPDEPGPVRTD